MKTYTTLCITLICFTTYLTGMEAEQQTPTASLNFLPPDILGVICEQLVRTVGTPAIINRADIPVIAKYINRLAATSKHCYAAVNNPRITERLIAALVKRFGITHMHAAAQLKTAGAKARAKEQIVASGELEPFKQMYAAHELAQSIAQSELSPELFEKFKCDKPEMGPGCTRSKQLMLQLSGDSGIIRAFLVGPWGTIPLYKSTHLDADSPIPVLMLLQKFIHATKAKFFDVANKDFSNDRLPYQRITHQLTLDVDPDEDISVKISRPELASLKGESLLIIGSANVFYTMGSLENGETTQASVPLKDERLHVEVSLLWNCMEELLKPGFTRASKTQMQAVSKGTLDTLSNGPAHYRSILERLANAQLSREKKFVTLCPADMRAFCYVFDAVQNFLPPRTPLVCLTIDFDQLYYISLRDMAEAAPPFPIEAYVNAYEQVIEILQSSWKRFPLAEHPCDKLESYSEEEWICFIRNPKLEDEVMLIHSLAEQLGVSNASACVHFSPQLCFWIKKNQFDSVIEAFGFKLDAL